MKIILDDSPAIRSMYKTEGMNRTADTFGLKELVRMKDHSFIRFVVMFSLLFPILTLIGFSQDNTASTGFDEQRIEQLELKIQELEKRVNDALSDPETVSAHSASDSNGGILTRFEDVDQRIRILERKRELEQDDLRVQKNSNPTLRAGAEGFSLRSANGDYQLRIRGYAQMDGRFFTADPRRLTRGTFTLRRVRLIFEGSLGKRFDFRLMPDFGNGQPVLQDMYLDSKLIPQLNIRVGKFKTPFGLERLQGGTDILFAERALPTSLAPNRDLGVQVSGDFWKGALNYAIGVFNGVSDGGSGDSDDNGGKDFAGRIFARPFRLTYIEWLKDFGFGFAGTVGNRNGTAAAPSLAGYKTSGQNTFFRYLSDGTANGTVVGSGRLHRISPQFHYYSGQFGVIGEFVVSSQDVRKGTAIETLQNRSWQVSASFVLTGEKASFKSVVPRNQQEGGSPIPGAFELVGRYNELRVDPDAFPVFANPLTAARSAKAWGLGLNWYINRNLKFSTDFERTRFVGGTPDGNRETEYALFSRMQVAY